MDRGFEVTIAVLTRDAGPVLPRLLDAVFAQRTRLRYEVLAIDSGSTDGTLDTLRQFPLRLIEIAKSDFNWGRTRDFAYQQCDSPIVVNLSQDAVPQRTDWLDRLTRPFFDDEAVAVTCGSSIPDPDRHFTQFTWERNGYFYFTREIKKFTDKYGKGLSFANSAVRRSAWERLRFDEQPTGEDFQFQKKLHAVGGKIVFPADAPVLHHHNYSFGSLYRRCRNEGYALRLMGCPYNELDLAADLVSPRKYVQWLREARRGSLKTAADVLFPILRPIAVYAGSRFARRPVWY